MAPSNASARSVMDLAKTIDIITRQTHPRQRAGPQAKVGATRPLYTPPVSTTASINNPYRNQLPRGPVRAYNSTAAESSGLRRAAGRAARGGRAARAARGGRAALGGRAGWHWGGGRGHQRVALGRRMRTSGTRHRQVQKGSTPLMASQCRFFVFRP